MIKKLVVILFMLVVVSGCNSEIKKIDQNYDIETEEKNTCFGDTKEYYKDGEQTIYLYCLNQINVYDDNNKISLKDYIQKNNLTIDEAIYHLVSKLNLEETLWDGGTKIYRDTQDEKTTNNGLTVIQCHTLENNQDIYIGPNSMQKNDQFCK